MKTVKVALCDRHEMPEDVTGSIFGATIDNPMMFNEMEQIVMAYISNAGLKSGDNMYLYVTGLTAAVVAVINTCIRNKISLTLYHYDKNTGEYAPQHLWQ